MERYHRADVWTQNPRRGWGLSTAEQYREYAAECLRLAQSAATDEDRARLLSMAQQWRELAEKLDEEERD